MDTITKGGVIWEYLKGEVTAGKEQITKADLMKVGYSAQAIENAIAEIKKDRVLNKPVTPTPALSVVGTSTASVGVLTVSGPAPVMGSSPAPFPQNQSEEKPTELMTHPADQDLINDLTAAIKADSEMGDKAGATKSVIPKNTEGSFMPAQQAWARGTVPSMNHQNLGASMSAIPAMPAELLHAPTTLVASEAGTPIIGAGAVSVPIPLPPRPKDIPAQAPPETPMVPPVTTMPKAPAPAVVMPKKKHGFLFKFFISVLFIIVLAGIGSGILYGMTGSWLPSSISSLPGLSSFTEKYSKEELFGVMLANIQKIKSLSYNASFDIKSMPYDGKTPRPVFSVATSTAQAPVKSTFIPISADSYLHAEFSGSTDIGSVNGPADLLLQNGELNGTVSGSFGDLSFASDAVFINVGGVMYIKLSKLPTLGLFDMSKVEGKWVRLDDEAKYELGIVDSVTIEKITSVPQVAEILGQTNSQNLTATYVGREMVGNRNTSKYSVASDKGGQIYVWIDSSRAFPIKISYISKTAYDANDTVMKDRMTEVAGVITFSHINEPVNLTAPAESIYAVEAYASLTGMTVEQYREHKQEGNVSTIFFALNNFKKIAGVFPEALDELKQTPVQIRTAYPKTAPKKPSVKTGFDFAPWADELPILANVPTDVYTRAPYLYATTTSKDFTIKYEIKLASSTPASQFVNGMNTMTSKAVSLEGLAATLKKKK